MKIKLPSGHWFLIDDEDFEKISLYKFFIFKSNGNYYVRGYLKGSQKWIFLHRLIMNLKHSSNLVIDHINRNGLDNRKLNLRTCDRDKNTYNAEPRKNKKHSIYKGVSKLPRKRNLSKSWVAQIQHRNKVFRGTFSKEKEAALAYNEKAKELFGEFAYLNKI